MATDWSKITPVYEKGEQPKKQKTDWSKITPVEDSGFLRGTADTGLSIARGLTTGVKMVSDSFGANNRVSKVASKIASGLGDLKSNDSKWEDQAGRQRMDAAEASGSKWNEFVAGAKNFAAQPLDMAAEGIGSSAPTLAAMALSRGKINPMAAGAGTGAVQGAGSVKGEIYDDVKQRHIAANLPEADAARRAQEAQSYTGENADQIALGAGLGAVAGTSGAEGAVSRIIGNTTKSGLKPIAANIAAEGATEFAQGGQERLASNIAAQREGFEADTWQGVVGQGTMEGLAGAGSGAVFGVGEAMAGGRPPVEFDPEAGAISKALAQHPDTVPAGQPIIPPPGLEPAQPIDPIAAQANYAKVIAQSDPMALDKAQGIASAMNQSAQGAESYTVAPHGEAGFTVVPTAWLTDDQLAEFSAIQGQGGMLPAPAAGQNPPIRVDSAGNAAPETPEQAAELAAIRQRLIDMGKPTPRGVNPNEQAASGTVRRAISAGMPQAVVETPGPRGVVETVPPRAIVEQPGPRGVVETAPGPRGIVETAQGNPYGATGRATAEVAQAGGEGTGNLAGQGVSDAVAVPAGSGMGNAAAGNVAGVAGDLPAGTAASGANAVIARVGTTPNSADPVTVRNGVVYVGEYPAQDFETGEDITVPEGATFEQVSDALRKGRVLSSKQRIYAGEKGMRQQPAADRQEAAAPAGQPDRRVDLARRQRVAEMDTETLRRELLTDAMTGLGNRRAYDESEKLPVQIVVDADGLKWVNDNLGHASGDKLLKAIGQALREETRSAYRVSGDEFIVQAETEAEAQAIMDRAVARMADARIDATNIDGQDIVLTGVGVSYGIAGDLHEAEKRLGQHKAERETQGHRAGRGEAPPNAAIGSARGEDQPGDAAGEARRVARPKKTLPPAKTADEFAERARKEFIKLIKDMGGIGVVEARDITGEPAHIANRMAPGLFRIGGNALDLVARRLNEAGYLSDADYNDVDGGVQAVRELVNQALGKEAVMTGADQETYNDLLQQEQRLAEQEEELSADMPASNEALARILADEADDIAFGDDLAPGDTAADMRAMGFTEDEINAELTTEQGAEAAGGTAAGRAGEGGQAGQGQEATEAGTREDGGFDLAGQSPAEVAAADKAAKKEAEKAEREANRATGPDVTADQVDLFNTQGGLFGSNRDDQPTKLDTAAASIDTELDAALKELADALKRQSSSLNTGVDPAILALGVKVGALYVAKGVVKFAQYSKAIIDALRKHGVSADQIKPHLKQFYAATKQAVDDATFDQMDDDRAVRGFDLDSLDAEQESAPAAPATNKAQEGENDAARKLDTAGAGALAGTSPTDGGANGRGGNASGESDGGSAGDGQGNPGSGAARLQPDGSLGNDAGESPVPGTRAGAGRGNGTKRGPRSGGGLQQDNGLGDNAGRAGAVSPEDAAPNAPKTDAPQFKLEDFIIDGDLGLGEGGQKTKFKNNVAAIRLLAKLDEESRPATPDEQRVLAKYVGWGGIAQAFDDANQDWAKEYAELRGLMSDKEHAAAARSTRYAHYTSREIVVDGIYAALRHMGFSGGRVLEGGAGVGNFIGLMPADMRSAGRVTAVEREPFAAKIARHLYPKQNVQQADFTEFVGNDDYYDAAVGNPPFASDPQVDGSGRKHLSGLSLHNYFFAKEVDMLREGGILAQVITNGFLDAKGDAARKYISGRAKLLGAIRLPNNAFSKNANTEVTTDLIFLQKLPEADWDTKATKEDAKRWMDVGTYTDSNGTDVALNRYFIANPQMMLGNYGAYGSMYGPDTPALVARDGQDTLALLREAVASLPANVYTDRAITNTTNAVNAAAVALDKPTVQEGGFYVDGDKLFQRLQDVAGEARGTPITAETKWTEKTKLGESGFDRIKQLTAMRGTLRSLLAAEIRGDDAMNGLRATLNQQYDAYTKKHGLLNDSGTARVFGDDPDFPLLASLEHGYTPGMGPAAAKTHGIKPFKSSAKKGPIFNQRVVDARKTVDKAESPADALSISMAERGKLDTDYIGQLLGMPASEVLENLSTGDKPLLFLDPASDEYVLRDAYLSGNVRAKLKQAQMAGMMNNVRALEDVIPEDVGAHEIVARVGSPWVPEKVYEEFAVELFGEGTKARVVYVAANSSFAVSITPGSEVKATNTWGTREYEGDMLLSALLNNRTIKVTAKDGEGKIYTLVKETENANTKAQEIRDRFQDWLFADPERSEVLVRAYNDTNNNYVTREYDGAWMRFPGKVPDSIIKFRRHQRNAIARIVQDRTALLDHVVGAGKTFTIIAAAMELKRTGLAKKPLIVVPNHLVKQWAADFYRLYPGAKILTATKKDFAKLNRRRFLAKIATGDWDAVIMAHSSFGFVKPAPEFEAKFNEAQIKNVVDTIKAVEDGEGDDKQKKRTVKQLQGLIERLENRIKALRDKPMDSLLDFEQIGVDQLFVDEAHLFKNLMFSTKMQQVQGLGDSAGSQRAYDMYIKANQIFEKNGRGQGLVFATGTPVSNSLAEMYHMMRYLMPDQMKEMGFESFDAWANTYASVNQVFMQKMGGDGYKASNRMSTFVNTIELLKVFDQVSDTVTMDDIKAAFKEENDGREFPLPKLKGDKRQPVALTKSQAQNDYMDAIAKRAKALETRKGPPQKGEDNALVIMTDARKAAMDIRLVMPDIAEREIGGRIDRAADAIIERYQQYDAYKGTQLVFSDMGTPLKQAKAELKEYEELRTVIDAGLTEQIQALAAVGNEDALSKIEDSEAAQEKLDAKGNDWLGAVKAALRGFSVYDDLKAALVERGIPEAEIAFIHDANTDDQKAALFRKVNSGQIRVIVGSTAKMGAGTNVQERLVALHHLDVPWKPSDIEQREGRIIRQGNTLADTIDGFEVEILAYVTQDTLDLRMWQIQEVKLKMINQLRTRKVGREIDNAFEDMEMSAGEMQAAATGNMDLLKEIQLRAEMKKLEQRKRSFDAQKSDLVNRSRKVNEQLASLPKQIEKAQRMDTAAKAYRDAIEKQRAGFKVVIDGKTYTNQADAGEYLEGKINARAKDDKGNDRAAPLAVVMDGVEYTARPVMAEAYANIRGDVSPFMLEFDGKTHNRRPVAAKAIAQAVAEAVADEKLEFVGKMGAFEISVEGQKSRYGKMLDVVVDVGGASLNMVIEVADENADAVKIANQVIKVADSLVTTAGGMLSYNTSQLERAKKAKAELGNTEMPGEWADAAKLEKARAEHKELLVKLKGADEKPADGDEKADDTAFSRADGLTDAEAIKRVVRVQGVVNGIKANWQNAPEIIVVANMQDAKVPQRVRDMDAEMKSNGASGEPRGFISAGKVYIVAGQHKSVEDVLTTVAHETLGHAGLRGLYGDALAPILRQIVNMRRAEVNAKVKEYGFDPSSERDLLRAAEEVLANMAQTRPEMGFVKRAIAAIRNWLRDNGLNLKLSDGDIIANWILPARAFIEGGRGPGGGSRATSFSRGKPSDPVTLDHRDWKRPKGDTFAGYATLAEYEAKLAADEEQAKRISESYRTGRDMTARYGIRTTQEIQRAEGIDSSSKDSTRSDDTAFSRTVEMRAAVSQRAADLLTTQKTFNNWWHKTVGTQYHKAHVDADYRKAFNAVQSYLSGMAMFANSSADLADRLIPQLNSIRDLWNAKQPSQADIKAISAPIFAGTLEDEKVYGGDELRGRFKLNQDQIDLYVQFRASVDKSLDDLGKTDILRYAGKDAEHLRDEVMAASTASRAAIKVAAHLNDIGKADDAKVVMDKGMRVADLKAKGYAPLTRFGKYTVHVTEGDEQLYFSLFESEAEANAMARQMRQDNPGATVTQGVLSAESYKLFNGISPDTLELFAGALGVENNALVQEYIKLAKSNRSAMKRMIKRKGIAGFSEDVPRILASFITSNARQSASNVYGGQMDKAAEAIPREKGDVKDEAIKMIDFARNPTEDAAKLRGMLFVQYIGGSVASAMVNLTQPLTMSYPYLHQFSKTAGRELARAMKLATVGGELDADMKQALKRAEMDGVVSPQEIHQLQAEAVKKGAGVGSLARMFGVKGGTANKLDDLSKRGLFAWGSLFSLAEQFNRRSTFIAAYNIARQNKESDPFAFAEKAVVETQGIYNRGNRPDWARGAPGALIFCVDETTEALTQRGWVGPDELKPGDMIASFDMGSDRLVWKPVKQVFVKEYDGEMVHATSRSLDMLMTPDHRVVHYKRVRTPGGKRGDTNWKLLVDEAQNVPANGRVQIPTAAEFEHTPTGEPVPDAMAPVIGWVVTEGHIWKHQKGRAEWGGAVFICQNEGGNAAQIRLDLQAAGLSWKETTWDYKAGNATHVRFCLKKSETELLRSLIPGKHLTPELLMRLTKEQIAALVDRMLLGDGSVNADGARSLIQNNGKTLEAFQMALTILGKSYSVRKHGPSCRAVLIREPSVNAVGRYSITKSDRVHYKGRVWCPIVPETSTWLARRNGMPFITHNTFKQYSISYMEFLVRLPPKEKAIALAILVLAAGLQGIPFADDLDDLIDTLAQQMGYAWNTKAEKEKFAASILGQTGAAFALHGTSALPGFPLDFSARLGMSNLLPGTGILLKNKTDKMGEVLDVFGVAGGVVKDALRGEVLPIAVRNMLKAADMANTGMYRDWSGKKVIDTDGLDAVTKLIGFHPAKVAGEGRAARMDMQDVQLVRNIEAAIAGDMAQGIFTGDKKAVAKAREALADWNAKNPDKPIVITNQQIMARVKKMAQTRRERLIASAPKELRGGLVE